MFKESRGYHGNLFLKGAYTYPQRFLTAKSLGGLSPKNICPICSGLSNKPSSIPCDNTDLHKFEKLCLNISLKLSALANLFLSILTICSHNSALPCGLCWASL